MGTCSSYCCSDYFEDKEREGFNTTRSITAPTITRLNFDYEMEGTTAIIIEELDVSAAVII